MRQTFKDRLRLLMKEDKPYTWARKVGIEKGLFQYYWQKEKIPTYENLLKIQNYSGCSLDWLLTGKTINMDQIENLPMIRETSPVYGALNIRRGKSLENVQKIYSGRNEKDIDLLEGIIDKLMPAKKKKASGRK